MRFSAYDSAPAYSALPFQHQTFPAPVNTAHVNKAQLYFSGRPLGVWALQRLVGLGEMTFQITCM